MSAAYSHSVAARLEHPIDFSLSGRKAVLSTLLVLTVLCPKIGHGAADAPPRVLLDALHVSNDGVTAAVEGGGTARLTLDPVLQRSVERLLAQAHAGTSAVTAIDVRTGRVLAWAGAHGATTAHAAVTETLAPAASLFKIVTTTALLEKHIAPDRTVCISGGASRLSLENLVRPRTGHALCAPFREALGRSRNAVFAQLATRFLKREDLMETADRLGFGNAAPLDVPATIGTLEVPEDDLGFGRAAAGFVGSRLSPVGAAYLATTIAAGGRALRLRLVESAEGYEAPRHRETLREAMHESTAREIARMMEVSIHSGTCREVFTDSDGQNYLGDVRAAGKTGTLQVDSGEPTTSWFVGFAPSRAPRIAVSVLLENGPGWREKANQVGRDVLRSYFAARGFRGVTMPDGA